MRSLSSKVTGCGPQVSTYAFLKKFQENYSANTAQNVKLSINVLFSKCDQLYRKLRI